MGGEDLSQQPKAHQLKYTTEHNGIERNMDKLKLFLMDFTLATLTMALTKRCSRTLVTPEELAFARRMAKSENLEDTRPTETVSANKINRRPTDTTVLLMSAVETYAQE